MAAARLTGFLARLPRLSLGTFPTPLVRLDRLSGQLAIDLWMKRDDCTGLALGGNKTRKLEFILADARARGARTIVTVGPLTSNHTMMTATGPGVKVSMFECFRMKSPDELFRESAAFFRLPIDPSSLLPHAIV